MTLEQFFEENTKVAVAFSGGVDSVYLSYVAHKYAEEVCAYYVKTAFQPQFEYEDAIRAAKEIGIQLKVLELDILSEKEVVSNPCNRCYYCKRIIFSSILKAAGSDGYKVIVDGTNASDDVSDRPGMKALRELKVMSPLRICGLTKDMIRIESKKAGLFTWSKPAYACLATRVPYGQLIDADILRRTEEAENYLMSLGFSDFRVRSIGDIAKIQVNHDQIQKLCDNRKAILSRLKEDYSDVLLDMEARDE